MQFKNAKFITSAATEKGFPVLKDDSGREFLEIAVIGRSNVGKSTLINHLLQTRGLAKTSATPGKTQLINFFSVDDSFALVDLPGYGYAKVSDSTRKQWGDLIKAYLRDRNSLHLLLFLIDFRRIPNEDDIHILEWIAQSQKEVILVFTKVDKLPITHRQTQLKKILQALPYSSIPYTLYSATQNLGRVELIGKIKELIRVSS
jgi:GTP-binding protein